MLQAGSLVLFTQPQMSDSFLALLYYIARCRRRILYISCLSSVISHFSNEPCFLLMVNGRDYNLGHRGRIHRFWCTWIILSVSVFPFTRVPILLRAKFFQWRIRPDMIRVPCFFSFFNTHAPVFGQLSWECPLLRYVHSSISHSL